MGLYRYLAGNGKGAPSEQVIEADSRQDSLEKLRRMGYMPIKYLGEAGLTGGGFGKKRADVFLFTRQLVPLLNSHIPLEKALGIIGESSETPEQKEFVNSLRQGLHEGKKFSDLVRSHGRVFPKYYANLIETGEETGCLPEVAKELYGFMNESKSLKDFIISSSIYPLVILSMTLLMLILMFTVFVPRFAGLFTSMGREAPRAMQLLMTASTVCGYALWVVPLLTGIAFFVLWQWLGKDGLWRAYSRRILALPLFGKLMIQLEMCKFLRTLGILVSNHVEIIRTVGIAKNVIRNPEIRDSFNDLAGSLKSGHRLSGALSGNAYLPPGAVAMIRMGEESGEVGEMIENVASNLEDDTRLKIKRLLSMFEPAVIIFLAVAILIVVVAIFMSIMEMNAINNVGV